MRLLGVDRHLGAALRLHGRRLPVHRIATLPTSPLTRMQAHMSIGGPAALTSVMPQLGPAVSLLGLAMFSTWAERKTNVGRRLTGSLMSFLLSWVLACAGALPAAHASYDLIWKYVLPSAIVLTVMATPESTGSSGLRSLRSRVFKRELMGTAVAFVLGSIGSVLGGIAAFKMALVAHQGMGFGAQWLTSLAQLPLSTAAQCCGCLTATYIGGSVNLLEVAKGTGLLIDGAGSGAAFGKSVLGALAAAEVALMGVYFALLLVVSNACETRPREAEAVSLRAAGGDRRRRVDGLWQLALGGGGGRKRRCVDWSSGALVLGASLLISQLGARGEALIDIAGSGSFIAVLLSLGLKRLLAARQLKVSSRVRAVASPMAATAIFLFFGAIGAGARLQGSMSLGTGVAALCLSACALFTHMAFLALSMRVVNGAASWFKGRRGTDDGVPLVSMRGALIASNAGIGGAATAAAFAGALGATELVVAAALCGTAGYAIGSALGVRATSVMLGHVASAGLS